MSNWAPRMRHQEVQSVELARRQMLITVHDAWNLRFESTFTKVLNRTNFAPPATNFSDQQHFGVLTAAQTAENAGNRTGQVALRLEF